MCNSRVEKYKYQVYCYQHNSINLFYFVAWFNKTVWAYIRLLYNFELYGNAISHLLYFEMLYHSLSHLVCYSPCACPSAGKTTSNFGREDNKGNPPTNTGALHTYREHHKTKTRLVAALTTLWQAANKQTSHWSKCRQGAVNWAAAATWEGKCSGFVGRLAWALTCLDSWEIYNSSITPVQSKGELQH